MKIRKMLGVLTMSLLLVFSVAGCGNDTSKEEASSAENEVATEAVSTETAETSSDENETDSEKSQTEDSNVSSDTNTNSGNVLIAYFSYTGNTENVAQRIAEYTGGDLAKIERAEEYGDLQTEAETEIKDGVHPEITVSVDNVADYDTIFVGYPIWWDEAPAMIATFLADNDFSGKTVIPFCTSASDDIDNSLHIFNELCPDAEIAEGLTANNLDDIEPWIQRLNLISDNNN